MDPARLLMIDVQEPRLTPDERALLGERRFGGVCLFRRNCVSADQVAELNAEMRELAGEEFIVAIDQEGGSVVRLHDVPFPPPAMALGAADDPELTRAVAAAAGRGLRAAGINVDFAPVADVNADPANPVIADRSFGSDPQRVARQVVAYSEGMQSEGVAATVKHFPGHGDVAVDSHLALPTLPFDRERLERVELVPFRAAIEAGVAAVMSGHLLVPALDPEWPATLSPAVMRDLLRGELGFEGVTFSDALDMGALTERWGPGEAAVRALEAGIDMPVRIAPLADHISAHEAVLRALDEGRLDPAALERAASRLDALIRRFPARPDPATAWAEGDDALLDAAAARGLVALGEPPRLAEGDRVVLVAAVRAASGAASDGADDPAASLAEALRGHGVTVERRSYDAGAPDADLLADLDGADAVLFVSTGRLRMDEPERRFARALGERAQRFVHVALWNPFHTRDLPGPAVVAFGFGERQTRAAAAALCGAASQGHAPVPLTVAGDT